MAQDKLTDEAARQAALGRYGILDTAAEGAFDTITNLVRTALGVPMAAVSLIDEERQWFKSHPGIAVSETPRDIAFCDHTIRSPGPMIVPDAREDARFRHNPLVTGDPNVTSYAGVPLTTPDGYNIGSLCAIDTQPRDYDPGQIHMLTALASLVVEQMELRNMAERDYLTGALTRRAFIADLDKKIALFTRHERPAALLLFDIDRFKAINDTYGHPAGDKVIKALADLCAALKRPNDSLGRLGGEEFALLLPETGEGEAVSAAQRFLEAIRNLEVDNEPPLRFTASFGVAALGAHLETSEAWLAAADAALYDAKRTGRDRVCAAAKPRNKAA